MALALRHRIYPKRVIWAFIALILALCMADQAAADRQTPLASAYQALSRLGQEYAALIIAALIRDGITEAENAGLEPLPDSVKQGFSGYFPQDMLDSVRWRAGYGTASLQKLVLEVGGVEAITLGRIIVFRHRKGVGKMRLLAHELGHVLQYQVWGIDGFARRYAKNSEMVEAEARRIVKDWQAGGYGCPATSEDCLR